MSTCYYCGGNHTTSECPMRSTAPKQFIFVLMPFEEKFDDIYTFGIKGAAEDANAYAERVDEQIFTEGILDRIFNQISKADVIVADMTDRNENVFYEVGYAHALGKIVLLLTQNADDIPFDLKHRPHTVYGGKIETLREELTKKIIWAIGESKKQGIVKSAERFFVSSYKTEIPEFRFSSPIPILKIGTAYLPISIRNISHETTPIIKYISLLKSAESSVEIKDVFTYSIIPDTFDTSDGLTIEIHLQTSLPSLPPGAAEIINLDFRNYSLNQEELIKLRIHTTNNFYDFPFKLKTKNN